MPLRFKHRILDFLSQEEYEPAAVAALAKAMRIEPDDRPVFEEAVAELAESGAIMVDDDGLIGLPEFEDELVGRLRLNPRGFGFIIPDQVYRYGDLFVPPGSTADAVSGDRVRAKVIKQHGRRGGSPYVGRIIEIVERGHEHFVGTLHHEHGRWHIEPDGRILSAPVLVRDPHAKNAKAGDKVVFELIQYPDGDQFGAGVITEVLGDAGKPDVETQAVITAHGLRTAFPEEVLDHARQLAREYDEQKPDDWQDREDLTDELIFTIDPPDAKDYDDAISIEYDTKRHEWTLGVHIADVAYFVEQGTALDTEAKQRGNSTYLPRLVLPMLPETLSNGICSLQEGVPRLTKSAFITFDSKGNVVGQRLASTVIKSAKRLTYLEAQALIDGDAKEARKHAKAEPKYSDELIEKLKQSDRLARTLQKRRRRDGMIVLDLPEVELIFDDDGHVIDAEPEDDAFTHTIIEMFMVEANEAVARTFAGLSLPLIRRVHPEPSFNDMEELAVYARTVQYRLPDEPSRHDMQRLLEMTHKTPAARAIHFAVLKTLSKASYSPAMIGHFALASDHYTHFTSPIRRYPDLTVHRAIQAFLELTDNGRNVPGGKKRKGFAGKLADDARVLDEGQLIEVGRHCSQTEVESEAAERELRDFLVMQFLEAHHLGDEFTGVITGMSSKAVFVSIEQFLVEGQVAISELPNPGGKADRWIAHRDTGRLVAKRSGASIGVGDVVTVLISRIDLPDRHMDLLITKMPDRMSKTSTAEPDHDRDGRKRGRRPKGKGKAGGKERSKGQGKSPGKSSGGRSKRGRR